MVEVLVHALRPVEERLAAIEGDESPFSVDLTAAAREVLSARWATTSTIEGKAEIVALAEPRARRQLESDVFARASERLDKKIKIGDLTGSSLELPMRALRTLYLADGSP